MKEKKTLVAGNWKMNTTPNEAMALTKGVVKEAKTFGETEVLLCPPFVWLGPVAETIRTTRIMLGGQNMYWEEQGAYTGEISASMLSAIGCDYVIIGHSERRQYFGETDQTVNKKLLKAIEEQLISVVCLGESLEQRENGKTDEVIASQFEKCFLNFSEFENIVIAYEPVWAIGTGKTATPEQAQEVHKLLRDLLKQKTQAFDSVQILYGGSVKPGNAADLISREDIDGFLVGGASLKAEDFVGIIKATL